MPIESFRDGIFSLPVAEVAGTPQVGRTEKRLKIFLPPGLEDPRPDETRQVVEAIEQIKIIEYDSGQPGELVFAGAGMHGEETREEYFSVVRRLDGMLSEQAKLISGAVVLIPNLNALGCARETKTRYVFEDEEHTNLNDEFHHYQTGEWDEFYTLSGKTRKYAWLFMKYLTSKRDEHRGRYGSEQQVTYFDLHAEETAIPHIRVDRMFEQQKVIERLLRTVWPIKIPAILEYPAAWQEDLYTTITAVASGQGIAAVTIEEGMTNEPDLYTRLYIAHQLIEYLQQQSIATLTAEEQKKFNEEFSPRYAPPSLRNALKLWNYQYDHAEILCLNDIPPTIIHEDGRSLSPRQLLKAVLSKGNWDGVLSLSHRVGLRGTRGGADVLLAKMAFGHRPADSLGGLWPPVDAHLWLPKFPETSWIVSVPESPDPGNRIIYYAFFETADEKTGERKIWLDMLQKSNQGAFLTPDQLRTGLEAEPEIEIDVSILEMTCAVPDPKWNGELKAGHIIISPKVG